MSGAVLPRPVARDRLTVVEQVYHRQVGHEPTMVESKFGRDLNTCEQVYHRQKVATEEWQPLDHGWIERAGMIVIKNEEGQGLAVVPTEEEKVSIASRVLELSFKECTRPRSVFLVPPGESFRGYPRDVRELHVRCQSGVARYTVYVVPE